MHRLAHLLSSPEENADADALRRAWRNVYRIERTMLGWRARPVGLNPGPFRARNPARLADRIGAAWADGGTP